jgi:hypothetical protein
MRDKHLGDFVLSQETFKGLDEILGAFQTEEFRLLGDQQKSERVNRLLLQLIQKEKSPTFLLAAVIHYIDRILQEKILDHYSFSSFELWLNQFSHLSSEENYRVRAHIIGKWIPREEYQVFFPIGMGKKYPGSHFVTAHHSPDLDTTVASFWGWVDAFGAQVSEGLHLWNVPGGPPASQIEIALLFTQIFGESIFTHLAKTRLSLALSSVDLMTQRGLRRTPMHESSLAIDHERNQNAVVLVDEQGYYLGDWRNFDVEGVRLVILLLGQCLRWFENNLHVQLISLFSKETLFSKDLPAFGKAVFQMRIRDCEPAKEFTEKQKKYLQDYLSKVLGVEKGLDSTFEEFAQGMKALHLVAFQEFIDLVASLQRSNLFDHTGKLVENRPRLFQVLEEIILGLDKAIQSVRLYVERLDVALHIKTQVFGYFPQVVSYRADVEELRSKMGAYPYLTVTSTDKEGRLTPLGIVHASELHKNILGTVSLRDFCNREETKIPSYLEVISVIDHHKSVLNTFSPPVAYISDSQSSNALVAEISCGINDQYSTSGMTLSQIEQQIDEVKRDLASPSQKRIFQRLLQRHLSAEKKGAFFIDPKREIIEYLHFLYAILDDTDLLTKVSLRDVECVASLLNRLKSLFLQKEVEIIAFDDLPRDAHFVSKAAQRILQNLDMYSLYSKIYLAKEEAVQHNLQLCMEGKPSCTFADTKEQNGCCRVGQTKMFAKNFPVFEKHAPMLRKLWMDDARAFYKENNEVDLHMHMISTVAGAEDLFQGTALSYSHKDELWIWIPTTEQAIEHLKSFLNAFRALPHLSQMGMEVEFLGNNAKELEQIFAESFIPLPHKKVDEQLPIAVLKFKAGSINSRKAMISPYLPHLTS